MTPAREEPVRHPFEDPAFWAGAGQVLALRRLHLTAALAAIAHVLAASVWAAPGTGREEELVAAAISVVAALAVVAVGARLLQHTALAGRTSEALSPVDRPLAVAAGALVVAGAAVAWTGPGRSDETARLPGFEATVRGIFLGQLVLLLTCFAVNRRAARRLREQMARGPRDRLTDPVWGGYATTLFAGGGWALGLLYSAAILFGVSWVLNLTGTGDPVATVTPTLRWAATALVVGAATMVVAGVLGWRAFVRLGRPSRQAAAAAATTPGDTAELIRAAGRWRALHRFTGEHALSLIGGVATAVGGVILLGGVIAVASIVDGIRGSRWLHWAYSPGDDDPASRPPVPIGWLDTDLTTVSDTGAILAVGLMLGLGLVIGVAYGSDTIRRVVGVLWDVATFWPRATHPFAPPCYADAVVPMIVTRAKQEDVPLLLAGHSQGSVIAVAGLFQLDEARRDSVHLVTFGTQLSRLYGRAFPAFFGRDSRDQLRAALTGPDGEVRWTSLYRPTDPLGWPIGTESRHDPVDVPVGDPGADGVIRQHGRYPVSTEYVRERDRAAGRLRLTAGSTPSAPPGRPSSGP